MKTIHGIIPTDDGQYLMVSLRAEETCIPRITVKQWNCHNKIRTMFLLHRGIICGVPSFWKSQKSRVPDTTLTAENAGKFFAPCASPTTSDIHQKALRNNCIAMVPDDAFLCTVPLYLGDHSVHSFVSVFALPQHYKIGIVINKELVAVFEMAPGTPDALEVHIGRIQRYFAQTCPLLAFPEHVYAMGSESNVNSTHFSLHPLNIIAGKHEFKTFDEIKALGVALTQTTGGVTAFSGPTPESPFRFMRSILYVVSAGVMACAITLTCVLFLLNIFTKWEVGANESRYLSIISNNREIKDLLSQNQSTVKSILRLQAKPSAQTRWGPFLHLLGMERPDGLFFEMLGSEPVKGVPGAVRVAFSGWAKSEKLVTDLISQIQKNNYVSDISLSSLEKNEKNATLCNFKILCTLTITGK